MLCNNCGHTTHDTRDCKWLGQPKCIRCGWFGHIAANCYHDLKQKNDRDKGEGPLKKPRQEWAHVATLTNDDSNMEPKMTFSAEEEASTCKFDTYDPLHPEIDDRLIFYDWLADSTTTSHVTNMHNAFISFKPLQNMPVNGVGSVMTHAKGQGTIELESETNIFSDSKMSFTFQLIHKTFFPLDAGINLVDSTKVAMVIYSS